MAAALVLSTSQINHLIASWGALIVFAAALLQSGGVPVPGSTVLISAALYAGTTHHLLIVAVIAAAAAGAILGQLASFLAGRRGGPVLLERYGSRVRLTPHRQAVSREVFARHGGRLVFLSRFITGLRTWGGVLAGVSGLEPRRFLGPSVVGGILWAALNGVGYYLFGHALTTASTGIDVVLGVLAVASLVVSARYLRRTLRTELERPAPEQAESPEPARPERVTPLSR